jgi:hypothetical protein
LGCFGAWDVLGLGPFVFGRFVLGRFVLGHFVLGRFILGRFVGAPLKQCLFNRSAAKFIIIRRLVRKRSIFKKIIISGDFELYLFEVEEYLYFSSHLEKR